MKHAATMNRRRALRLGAGAVGATLLPSLGVPWRIEQRAAVWASEGASPPTSVASGRRAAVATVHPLATRAAIGAIRRGGNAIDAAVAAALMLGVVDGHNSGIGGGCFILAQTADGQLVAIDGRETAPGRAERDMFIHDGEPDVSLSQTGPLASGVPGQVAALALLSLRHGRGGWSAAAAEAARVASDGHPVAASTASAIRRKAKDLARFPASAAQFLRPDGSPPAAGDLLRQEDLGRTLAALAEHGPDWFYRGPFATACEQWMQDNGGIMTSADLAGYLAKPRDPVRCQYRDHQVVGFPPPSSGGIHIAQMLIMLQRFEVGELLAQQPATLVHLLAEVMKRAFADRAHWLGDADHAEVPRGLVDPAYCQRLAEDINLQRAVAVESHGIPPRADDDLFSRQHTTHLTTADDDGNWVAITNTVNTTFGSSVVIPGTGVVMNNEMDDFSIAPGTPNAFGLIGAEANSIQPGKRPLSSMSPTIVLDPEGRPRLTCGAAGGPRIINATLQCILRVIDGGMPVDKALAAPRVHHQWSPDQLLLESDWPEQLTDELQRRGHQLARPRGIGVAQAIERTADGQLRAASDPRVSGSAEAL